MTHQLSNLGTAAQFCTRIVRPQGGWQQNRSRHAQPERPAAWFDKLGRIAAAAGVSATVRLPLIWLRRARNRRELAGLDVGQLRDVGLDPGTVRREATKPFWRE